MPINCEGPLTLTDKLVANIASNQIWIGLAASGVAIGADLTWDNYTPATGECGWIDVNEATRLEMTQNANADYLTEDANWTYRLYYCKYDSTHISLTTRPAVPTGGVSNIVTGGSPTGYGECHGLLYPSGGTIKCMVEGSGTPHGAGGPWAITGSGTESNGINLRMVFHKF